MCTKKCFRMPTLVILGVILTIVLVFITGITLTNSINISNIVRLREKVASDSAAANSANAAQTRAALVEQQYSTLQQHHLSRSDLNYITANHPKNLQRFLQTTQVQQAQQQPQPPLTPHSSLHSQTPQQYLPTQTVGSSTNNNNLNKNKIIIEIGIRNFTAAAATAAIAAHQKQQQQQQLQQQLLQTNNRSLSLASNNVSLSSASTSSVDRNQTTVERNVVSASGAATIVEQLVAPFDGAIINGNIESISVPATSEIQQQLNETLKYLAENDKTVTSPESKNSLTLNRLPPPNILQSLNASLNAAASPSLILNATATSSSLVAATKSFLNNSLNSSTSSNVAAVSEETILFSTLSSTIPPVPVSRATSEIPTTTAATTTTSSPSSSSTPLTTTAVNQLSIEDHNPGMIDFEKRNYVKKVKIIFSFYRF